MKWSLIVALAFVWSGMVQAEPKRSLDKVDSSLKSTVEIKESADKPGAVAELVDAKTGKVTVYSLTAVDKRIANNELEKLSKEDKAKALDEINLNVAKVGKKLAEYDIPKRSLDKEEATSAHYRYRRYWAYNGGYTGYSYGYQASFYYQAPMYYQTPVYYGGYFGGYNSAPSYYWNYNQTYYAPVYYSAGYTGCAYYW